MVKAAAAVPAEELGLEVEIEDIEVPYLEEVTVLAADISAMYLTQKKRRTGRGEDGDAVEAVAAIYADSPVDSETRMNAVIRLGFLLSQRAEELAGITAEKIIANEDRYDGEDLIAYYDGRDKLKEAKDVLGEHFNNRSAIREKYGAGSAELIAYDAEEDEMRAAVRVMEAEDRKASSDIHRLDHHPKTQKELERLAAGYVAALSELRGMGGDMQWENERNGPVVKMFNSAAQVYPSEWIDYSNQFMHPFARDLKQRAHYQHIAEKKKNVKYVNRELLRRYPVDEPPQDSITMMYVLATTDEASKQYDPEPGYEVWKQITMEVDGYTSDRKRLAGGDGRPVGSGWTKYEWTGANNKPLSTWRRPEKVMLYDEVDSIIAPEIITNLNSKSDSKRHNGYATAVHELSHRYEAMVPEVLEMEKDFFDYRTGNKETGEQNPLINISPAGKGRTPEKAREGGFIAKYMGREYGMLDAYEVLSCGMESLFGYSYGGLIGLGKSAKDEHMRSFVLGVLGSAGRRYLADGTSE